MKGHLLVSHHILDRSAQAQVFVSTGPVFGVNEESISAVSPQNFREKGKSLFETRCSGNQALPPPPFSPLTLNQDTVLYETGYPDSLGV